MDKKAVKLKYFIVHGILWKLFERFGSQGLQFIVQIILARLLLPQDYGILALVIIFITIARVFVQGGLGTSLIQKKQIDDIDSSSMFYVTMGIACVLYSVLFFSAPLIADFYNNKTLISILRVLSLTLFPGSLYAIQNAIVARAMQFRKIFYSSLGAGIISGLVGILLAYSGFGVWALVFQYLINQVINTVILWFILKWRPIFAFSLHRVKGLYSFGWKLLVSGLLDTIYRNLRGLIIGKAYSPTMLGFYNRGQEFPQFLIANINGTIQSVMLPALASHQDDSKRVKSMMRRSLVTSSFFVFPMIMGLIVIAEPLVILLLSDKWLQAVPFLQILSFSYALWPIQTANLQAINAMGRSDIFLKLEIIKKVYGSLILFMALPFGVYVLAISQVISSLIASFINAKPNKKLLSYSYREQISDILPSLLLSLGMGVIIYLLRFLSLSPLATMLLQIAVGMGIYPSLAYIFKLECFTYIRETVWAMLGKNTNQKIV